MRRELDENLLDPEEGQIVEERKTLQWLKDELRREKEPESHCGEIEVEQPEG